MEGNNKLIKMEDTRFIFKTNFSGDPNRDTYGSTARKGTIVIPDIGLADFMRSEGFNVKETKPRPGEEEDYIPECYVSFNASYDSSWPPAIYLVPENGPAILLDEDTVSRIDHIRVKNVNAVFNVYENQRTGKKSLYVRTMYVEQDVDSDPFASRYLR